MEEKRKYACWLYSVPGIGNRTVERLLEACPDVERIYREGEKLWRHVLTAGQLEQIQLFAQRTEPDVLCRRLLDSNIRFVLRSDEDYPRRLLNIPDPPYGLFVKGSLPGEEAPAVAVVGARDCSGYGSFVADGIGRALGADGIQVISGMARGIDGISQNAALEAGGRSFGVLGCGVDVCYPAANKALYDRLCTQGGILSAFPVGMQARPQNFPPRNRIVSGLADALIVVEARHRSGTLITVDMALEQGKEVYVVPGRVTDRLSDGCNRLIKQGAGVFLSPEDFLRELREGWQEQRERIECKALEWRVPDRLSGLSPEHREVYGILDFEPLSLGQIQGRLQEEYAWPKLMTVLMGLCTERLAVQVSPGHFVRRGEV